MILLQVIDGYFFDGTEKQLAEQYFNKTYGGNK